MRRTGPRLIGRVLIAATAASAAAWLVVAAPAGDAPPPRQAAANAQTAPAAQAERIPYLPARKLADLEDRQVAESSGMAASRWSDGVFWTHNDSGDRARLFAFDKQGRSLATLEVTGVVALDWEDICSVKQGSRSLLLIADTGDNLGIRPMKQIHVVEEPKLDPTRRSASLKARCLQTIHFRFEDGRFDCESIAADVASRRIYLVSKIRRQGEVCKVYSLVWPNRPGSTVWVAKPLVTLKIPNTTAMDLSADGLRAVVLTYGNAYEYVRSAKETWEQGFAREPRTIPLPPRRQGEAICYGLDGKTLYLTSEGAPCPLWEVGVKEAK